MKERPILFSAPMVRAIIDGRKTQTRRPARIDAATASALDSRSGWSWTFGADGFGGAHQIVDGGTFSVPVPRSILGAPGDRLWVRETWSPWSDVVDCGEAAKLRDARAQMPWACILYGADRAWSENQPGDNGGKWRPSIHMPRWASRLTLAVTTVRVERLQAITEADAIAEGARRFDDLPAGRYATAARWSMGLPPNTDHCLGTARYAFGNLWDRVYAATPWASNPWVWVIEFKRATEGDTP